MLEIKPTGTFFNNSITQRQPLNDTKNFFSEKIAESKTFSGNYRFYAAIVYMLHESTPV